MITEQDVEEALDYLRDSAQEYSQWRALERYYEHKLKRIESIEFVNVDKGAVEFKRMVARASENYGQCLEDYKDAKYNSELLSAKRMGAQLTISYYQTYTRAKVGGY